MATATQPQQPPSSGLPIIAFVPPPWRTALAAFLVYLSTSPRFTTSYWRMTDNYTFKLGNALETKRSMDRLMSLRKRGANVTSIQVQATRKFQRQTAETFDMDDLLHKLSQVSTLENFSMKLLTDGTVSLPFRSVQTLLHQCRSLKSLVLVNVQFSGDATLRLKHLASAQSSLESLRLVSCEAEESMEEEDNFKECLSHLLMGLAKNIPSLQSVVCTNNSFVSEDLAIQALLELVSTDHITSLTIRNCNLLPTSLFRPLEALKANNTLKILVLDTQEPTTDQILQWIGKMLGENQTLEELSVDCRNASLMPIAHALKINRSLKSFHILGNARYMPEPQVEEAFASLLKDNYVLHHLGVPGARWSHNIDYYLRLNRAGRQYLWNTERVFQADWINAIIRCHYDTPIIYELISQNPSAICQLRVVEDSSSEEESSDEDDGEPVPKRRRTF